MPAITCRDCSTSYAAKRKDATRCPSCRMLSILVFATKKWRRPKSCRICSEKFLPLRDKDFAYCGRCELSHQTKVRGTGAPGLCVVCKNTRESTEGIPVCRLCLKHPDHRSDILARLVRGKKERLEASSAST